MDFLFKLINIHINEQTTLPWLPLFQMKKYKYFLILISFFGNLTSFLALWIVTTPIVNNAFFKLKNMDSLIDWIIKKLKNSYKISL